MEIEREFLVEFLPSLDGVLFNKLIQAYLSFEPEVRIRSLDNKKFYLTQKSNGDLSRWEIEPEIDNLSFQILTNLINGRVINKTRYYVPLNGGLVAELDVYHEEFEWLITVETEFKSEEDASNFEIPSWYGREITYDKRYKNKNLANCSAEELKALLSESVGHPRVRK